MPSMQPALLSSGYIEATRCHASSLPVHAPMRIPAPCSVYSTLINLL
jgi:hypothetical protein